MYSQDQAKTPTAPQGSNGLDDMAQQMAGNLLGYSPEAQNDILDRVISILRKEREIQLKDAQSHLQFLESQVRYINGLSSVGMEIKGPANQAYR